MGVKGKACSTARKTVSHLIFRKDILPFLFSTPETRDGLARVVAALPHQPFTPEGLTLFYPFCGTCNSLVVHLRRAA